MIRKHLITSCVMLGLFIAANSFVYNTPVTLLKLISLDKKPKKDQVTPDPYFNSLSFASENLPLGDRRIQSKMNSTLRAHSHIKLQTSKLHNYASKWFPIIEPILKKYGIPEDFKYMPLVESGLHGGTSPKGASGLWQLMPETARDFGLEVNGDIDDRHNIQKSTVAAAKYLKSLYRVFDSWTLAAAAYNIGEGSLKRQINKQNQDNYFKMKLNRETASYVYKLISMKEIIENPTRYGYTSKVSSLLARANEVPARNFPYDVKAGNHIEGTAQILRN